MSRPAVPAVQKVGLLTRVARDWFTDATGRGYSIGRGLGTFIILLFCCFPIGIAIFMGVQTGNKPSMADWVQLLNALALYVPAVSAAAAGLILGTAPTDPGGAWWSHTNAPPSTTTVHSEATPPAGATTVRTNEPGAPPAPPPTEEDH